MESDNEQHSYGEEILYKLNTDHPASYRELAKNINQNPELGMVMIQHEFGFFAKNESAFRNFLSEVTKPIIIVFHTILPRPNYSLRENVQYISNISSSIIVMTKSSAEILHDDYEVSKGKITVIPHGTHLVRHSDKTVLKDKYKLTGKRVLSTFGLLSRGKSIETTIEALPSIVSKNPDVLFLIIGKTHPSVFLNEGEEYRQMLEKRVAELNLTSYVKFINYFLTLPELLEYLQLTDIYLFTSRDPNQAVSGTFSYAISCGCPVISTPIPHAREVLKDDPGIVFEFENHQQLSEAVIRLLNDEQLRKNISSNGIHRMAPTAWENASIAHAKLFQKIDPNEMVLKYDLPEINLEHIENLTTDFGMIQFSKINRPDIDSGYTLDDNARAMIAMCHHFELTGDEKDLKYINIYFNYIKYCFQPNGTFLNYINKNKCFTEQNNLTNLDDAKGRAIWALGYLASIINLLPIEWNSIGEEAEEIINKSLLQMKNVHSTRAMAFVLKGLYYRNLITKSDKDLRLIKLLADRLVQMYRHESDKVWHWFESYLTYANSIIPEALLCAWKVTGNSIYKETAKSSFDFLLSKTFRKDNISVISNNGWFHRGMESIPSMIGGQQPIDVAYTILALSKFYDVFKDDSYRDAAEASFNWFLGSNHLNQIIYNPCTGGCYDGLEEKNVNLNQGAESTVSYLMARLTIESLYNSQKNQNSAAIDNLISQLQEQSI